MTMSILDTLALLPSGARDQSLSLDQLGRYLRDQYFTKAKDEREARHRLRDELYRDGGIAAMELLIDNLFQDEDVRALRKRWIKPARFNNAIKRIVNELSTVYSEPAVREVENPDDDRKYQEVQLLCMQAQRFVEVNRLMNLHHAVLVGFRVRDLPDGTSEPVIDIATPSNARPIYHPNDTTLIVGWLIRLAHRNFHTSETDRVPAWVLETDHERIWLNEDGAILGEPKLLDYGCNRWVPVTRGGGMWPGDESQEGEDLVAAQLSIWFANICMLKETKSATNQSVLSGDLATTARGQAMDTETPIEVPEGVSVSTVDMSMDVSMFGATSDHILEHVGSNYGLSPALLKHQGVQSAEARELMRVPIRELRREQQVPLRRFERRFAEVQSRILRRDMPELAFSTKGWSIDFGEAQTPLTESETAVLFEKQRQLGLTNTVDFILARNPDLTEAQAKDLVLRNVELEVWRQREQRPLMAINGGMGQPLDEARTPAQNGALAQSAEETQPEEMAS